MDGDLLSVTSTAVWVLKDFCVSLALALGLLLIRSRKPQGPSVDRWPLAAKRRGGARRWSSSATAIPVLVWAFDINELQRLVYSTHASTQPMMLLASMQEILGAVILLALILALDLFGRYIEARRLAQPLVGLPTGVVLALGTVLADWLLSQIGWWALLRDHL